MQILNQTRGKKSHKPDECRFTHPTKTNSHQSKPPLTFPFKTNANSTKATKHQPASRDDLTDAPISDGEGEDGEAEEENDEDEHDE